MIEKTPILEKLGFNDFFVGQMGDTSFIPARVASEKRGVYKVWFGEGDEICEASGRFKRKDGAVSPKVGDWVLIEKSDGGRELSIEGVLSRRTVFTRGTAGRTSSDQVVAANIDIVFVVCALDDDYSIRRIERYLTRVWASGAVPVVILSKSDLCEDVRQRRLEVQSRSPGVEVIPITSKEQETLEQVRSLLIPGTTVALMGSSGVGKSTLVNALCREEIMATGSVRERDGKGRHVTTHRQMIQVPTGGILVDTPGMRELRIPDEDGLDKAFEDVNDLSAGCRFRDCTHVSEPGCAVLKAVQNGKLSYDRMDHYRSLVREARSYELRKNEHHRRKSERIRGTLHEEANKARKLKEYE